MSEEKSNPALPTAVVEAVGKASEAMEYVERARGALYDFHQLMGRADIEFGKAVEMLEKADHPEHARQLDREIVGRNVLDGRWTFQIVDEFDDLYYGCAREMVRRLVDELCAGERHAYERRMKEDRRTHGEPGHEALPPRRRASARPG